MKVLISVVSASEARIALEGRADIIDIKNPLEGSLGAQYPRIIREIADLSKRSGILCSAALGDLPYKPGTAALAALGAAECAVDYIKAGLYGARNYDEAYIMIKNIVDAVRMGNRPALVVAAGYADSARFGGIGYRELVRAAKDARADIVMVDTAIKDGRNLF
ncbi:MAG TPA: (5-formylfuran-3-yl)methyl phosphate synthase, partial [Bacteroidales bacterium]|nr:(5-formylfuran-3-yl)methyl phosphate synthase [Bacteroidales bacterium]